MKQSKMLLKYNRPVPEKDDFARYCTSGNSWENYSLPLGNGYFGANIFGRTVTERIQISEPTLANPYYAPKTVVRHGCCAAGVNNFLEILIDFMHEDATDYDMSLSLDDAVCTVSYTHNGVSYKRTAFTSHPDNILVVKIEASKEGAVSMKLRPFIPFIGNFTIEEGDGLKKTGKLEVAGDTITVSGEMSYYGIEYEGILKLLHSGGTLTPESDAIVIDGADDVTLLFSCGTNYELKESVFTENDPAKKLSGNAHPHERVSTVIKAATAYSYEELLERHLKDYKALYDRVGLSLGEECPDKCTDKLLHDYKDGKSSRYLESLLFQYGRYLLISSSRSALPANLQGLWNAYCDSPWSVGFWHNINVQMNYWLSGPANLSELFIPYLNYAKAYIKQAKRNADKFLLKNYPDKFTNEEENGWLIGTACMPYKIDAFSSVVHSGPGTGAFTSLLFWDYYEFTGDKEFLREFGYPMLREMSLFFSKILTDYDGTLLVKESASPENMHEGKHYHTVGCAFDQQMVYENYKRTLDAQKILGLPDDELLSTIRSQIDRLEPVLIGLDGQVKEYREETYYSSIGDKHHRHISHLVGLYPCSIINETTPEWLEASKVTLTNRGDLSRGWAVAHRLLLWSRTKTPHKSMDLIKSLISNNIMDNLWDSHPPFQIDGNFGYTAGVCEMLLQSQAGYIDLLPSLPDEWATGEFAGLVARGNFVVDCAWENKKITRISITSKNGGMLKIKLPDYLVTPDMTLDGNIFQRDTGINETVSF